VSPPIRDTENLYFVPGNFSEVDEFTQIVDEKPLLAAKYRKLLDSTMIYYRSDDLRDLAFGELESLALPGCSFKLAMTKSKADAIFEDDGVRLLPDRADMIGQYCDLLSDRGY
jgi:hypothetical protein